MILKSLYIKFGELNHPDNPRHYPIEYTYCFLKQSRCLCNYLEREVLKPLRFRGEGFDRIVVSLVHQPSDRIFVNSCKVMEVEASLDQQEYDTRHLDSCKLESSARRELMEYFIQRLTEGLVKCATFATIPIDELISGIDRFVSGGMVNRWVHKRRTFKSQGLKAELVCDLSISSFTLRLVVVRDGAVVLNELILSTDPDENAYEYLFDDIVIIEDKLVVTSKHTPSPWARELQKIT